MERIENPMVMYRSCESTPKVLEICACCGDKLYHGNKVCRIDGKVYCEFCVETDTLDADDYCLED